MEKLERQITEKMELLNQTGVAVVFAVTGGNGAGKTEFSRRLMTRLPFYQSFNLGLVTKTLCCLTNMQSVSMLENFHDKTADEVFTHVIQYSCNEYQKTGVNVVIDGVQIDSTILARDRNLLGGVILEVSDGVRAARNNEPATHFKRVLKRESDADMRRYEPNDKFAVVNNSSDVKATYSNILKQLDILLNKTLVERGITYER